MIFFADPIHLILGGLISVTVALLECEFVYSSRILRILECVCRDKGWWFRNAFWVVLFRLFRLFWCAPTDFLIFVPVPLGFFLALVCLLRQTLD